MSAISCVCVFFFNRDGPIVSTSPLKAPAVDKLGYTNFYENDMFRVTKLTLSGYSIVGRLFSRHSHDGYPDSTALDPFQNWFALLLSCHILRTKSSARNRLKYVVAS